MNDELRRTFEPGERVVWEGRPGQGLMFRPSDRVSIPFSFVWCGMVGYDLADGWEAGKTLSQFLFGGLFAMVGVYLLLGRFVVDALARMRTVYAVTNRRVIIIRGLMERTVHTINLSGLAEIALTHGRAGRGTLTFDRAIVNSGPDSTYQVPSLAFEEIEDVAFVLSVIRKGQ